MKTETLERTVELPAPVRAGRTTLEEALLERRSCRKFGSEALSASELSQVLWAAQGMTDLEGRRTTPSAGASFPLQVHVLVGEVDGMAPAHYRYLPRRNVLLEIERADLRMDVARAAHDQEWMGEAPAILALTAIFARTTGLYGDRGERYVVFESGCAAQNVQLQAVTLGLASVVVGAFDDLAVARALRLPDWETPLVLLPVGSPADGGDRPRRSSARS